MEEKKPLILVVNDDGYEAKGLEAMVSIAKPLGEVVVVVPDRTRSGMGHAITMGEPLRITNYKNEDGVAYYKTNGTPVDCVKLGEKVVLRDRKIDLVLSGINHGSNSSVSLIYSGTMAAAIEATFDNLPAVGLSLLDYSPDADFTAAIHYGSILVKQVLEHGLPPYICLNINVPKVPVEEIKGVQVTRQCPATWHEDLQERTDPYGRKYYWLTGWLERHELTEGTCEWALQHNYVSVQPVQFDLTAYQYIPNLKYLEK
jgi:5'-nucleotidase